MKIAKPLADLIDSFQKLPGIGPKTAQRLTYYMLHVPQTQLDDFADSLSNLKRDTKICNICKNVTETDPCYICSSGTRDESVLLVVEQPLDILVFERTGKFSGYYHTLHGAINPLENIGPDEIYIEDLIIRVMDGGSKVKEVIIATNPTMEGDATAMYIKKRLNARLTNGRAVAVTRLGMGVPTGADLEYADDTTLTQAIEGRRKM